MNIGTFAGRIGRDASTNETQSGKSVTNFSLAVDAGFGENKSTLWVSCAIWGDRGVKVAQYLTKGKQVTVMGRIAIRTYQGKDGSTKAELTCDVLEFTLQGGGTESAQPKTAPSSAPVSAKADADFNDDIPF